MGRCNNRRVQQAAQQSRSTPARARFSKPPPSKKKSGRGGGRGRGDKNNSGRGGGRGRGSGRSNTNHAAVINKISNRVQAKKVGATTRTLQQSANGPLSGVDISKLDEITLSEASIQVVTKLLTDLNVMESTESRDEETKEEFDENDSVDDTSFDQQHEMDEDAIFDEQKRFSATNSGYSEYEEDFEEDYLDDDPMNTIDDADNSESNIDDDDSEHDSNDIVRESPLFKHLTTQFSFSDSNIERACRAIENWQVPSTATTSSSTTTTTKHSDGLDNDQLALAMDWLCLHLTDDELKTGFRSNPNSRHRKPIIGGKSGIILAGTGRTRPIPHPSISITSDKEWRETLKRQSRKVGFFRLGFHHAEAETACDEAMHVSEKVSAEDDGDGLRVMLALLEKDTLGDSLVIEEPSNKADSDFAASEREQEVQALEAIFEDSFRAESDRYLLTVTPVEDLQLPGHSDECRLHVFVRPGYPVLSPPLLLFTNPTLPPTLLRRINVSLIQHAHESIGEPIIFAAMDFLANNIHEMQMNFVKEQRAKEMEADQLRMRKEAGHDIDQVVEAQYENDGKLGRRQRAKLRAAEKSYDHSESMQRKEKERLKRQEERLERIKDEHGSLRVKRAERAIEEREKVRIEEEAERASRSAMNASFNRGETVEEARAAALKARNESLRSNGQEAAFAEEEEAGENNSASLPNSDETTKAEETFPSVDFEDEDISTEGPVLIDTKPAVDESTSTPATMAFMERLRKCYNDAVQEKTSQEKAVNAIAERNDDNKEDVEIDVKEPGKYHLCDPLSANESTVVASAHKETKSSHVPTPVPVPTGDLADVMTDVIQAQNEQPWLISKEARTPTVQVKAPELTQKERSRCLQISKQMREELTRKQKAAKVKGAKPNKQFHKMLSQRQRLPAYSMKEEIVATIKQNQVTVISGDTGCGKTTQVPQLVLDDMITNGCGAEASMVVTQPRRISAIGVANRIADERCERVGETAGYSIRLENKRSSKTRLLLCTTGILLRRLQCDPDLASVSHVFVDEVHERDLNTDFLLIVLKDLLARRKSLKLVLMSATLNATAFSDFFGGCPVVSIPGRAFPVKENRLEDVLEMTGYEVPEDSDYALKVSKSRPARFSKSALRKMYHPKYSSSTITSLSIVDESVINYEMIAELVEHICVNNEEGAILIFLPGIGEITKAIEELYKKEVFQSSKTVIYPLHSSLSTAEQTAIFEVPPEGVRKIVVATNIAETSITIEDVVYVVDTGRLKENRKDEVNEMPTLVETWVSRASAKQRRGRAGRVREGIAYHMFSSHTYEHDLQEYQLPEMLRVGLEDLVLQILLLDLGEPTSFLAKAVNPPSALAMRNSLKLLEGLGAVEVDWMSDTNVSRPEVKSADSPSCETVSAESGLTALGFHLATLPVDPRVGKMMIYGALFQCTDPALTIAASMSARSPFVSPFDKRDQADAARKEFATEGSDHLTTLSAFNKWKDMRRTKGDKATRAFLQDSFLSRLTLFQMEDLRKQFSSLLIDVGFLPSNFRLKGANFRNQRGSNNRGPEASPASAADAYSDNVPLIKAILCAGLYPNIIVAPRNLVGPGGSSGMQVGECAFQSLKGEVYLHPSTISFSEKKLDSRYCCYHEIVQTSKIYVRDCTTVSPYALLLFGGSLKVYHTHGVVTVDNWLKFRISPKAAALVKHLRAQMESMLLKKIVSPGEDITGSDESKALIQAVSTLFASEIDSAVEQSGADIVRPWTGEPDGERRGERRSGRGRGRGGRGSRGGGRGRGRGSNR